MKILLVILSLLVYSVDSEAALIKIKNKINNFGPVVAGPAPVRFQARVSPVRVSPVRVNVAPVRVGFHATQPVIFRERFHYNYTAPLVVRQNVSYPLVVTDPQPVVVKEQVTVVQEQAPQKVVIQEQAPQKVILRETTCPATQSFQGTCGATSQLRSY